MTRLDQRHLAVCQSRAPSVRHYCHPWRTRSANAVSWNMNMTSQNAWAYPCPPEPTRPANAAVWMQPSTCLVRAQSASSRQNQCMSVGAYPRISPVHTTNAPRSTALVGMAHCLRSRATPVCTQANALPQDAHTTIAHAARTLCALPSWPRSHLAHLHAHINEAIRISSGCALRTSSCTAHGTTCLRCPLGGALLRRNARPRPHTC